jgi:hypothetical protein
MMFENQLETFTKTAPRARASDQALATKSHLYVLVKKSIFIATNNEIFVEFEFYF